MKGFVSRSRECKIMPWKKPGPSSLSSSVCSSGKKLAKWSLIFRFLCFFHRAATILVLYSIRCEWLKRPMSESSTSLCTGVVALQSLAVESIPYVIKKGNIGWGRTPLHVDVSALIKLTTAPVVYETPDKGVMQKMQWFRCAWLSNRETLCRIQIGNLSPFRISMHAQNPNLCIYLYNNPNKK